MKQYVLKTTVTAIRHDIEDEHGNVIKGYCVMFEDGLVIWYEKSTFEEHYRELNNHKVPVH